MRSHPGSGRYWPKIHQQVWAGDLDWRITSAGGNENGMWPSQCRVTGSPRWNPIGYLPLKDKWKKKSQGMRPRRNHHRTEQKTRRGCCYRNQPPTKRGINHCITKTCHAKHCLLQEAHPEPLQIPTPTWAEPTVLWLQGISCLPEPYTLYWNCPTSCWWVFTTLWASWDEKLCLIHLLSTFTHLLPDITGTQILVQN